MINVVARITVQPGRGADLEEAVREVRPGVLAGAGCLRYDLQRVRRSETDYLMLEAWESTDALKQHGASEAFAAFGARLADVVAGPPEVTVLEPIGDQVPLPGTVADR